jgi:hypothetical protein
MSTEAPVRNDPAITEVREGFNHIRLGMFNAIEAVGLPRKQENALKALIRQLTYDAQGNLEAALRRSPR